MNKIDLKHADPERVCKELESIFDIKPETVLKISAKNGIGIEEVLKAVIRNIPPPKSIRSEKFCALLFDSWYDKYRGALNLVFVKDGEINVGQEITSCNSGKSYEVRSLSMMRPMEVPVQKLYKNFQFSNKKKGF